jgi:hypothetical protein
VQNIELTLSTYPLVAKKQDSYGSSASPSFIPTAPSYPSSSSSSSHHHHSGMYQFKKIGNGVMGTEYSAYFLALVIVFVSLVLMNTGIKLKRL